MSALTGLSIVDFSRFLPGAYASWIAADMGAQVIRIEHPRELAKHAAMMGGASDEADARRRRARPTYFRGKKSLVINPGQPAARPVLEALIAKADVLIEDYRPGVMAAMGYGADAMCALNPRLIYMSVTFAGQDGPMAGQAGHDPLALALSGTLARLNGLPEPSLPGLQIADVLTGAHGSIAMLLALAERDRTGRGQHVDVNMADACMPLHLVNMGRFDDLNAMPPAGTWHPKGGVWRCRDGGYICTTDMEPAYWARFCEAMGRPDYAAKLHDTAAHPAMQTDLAALFLTKDRDEWMAILNAAQTQAMPVYSAEEALAHPHHQARGRVVSVPVEGQEPVRQLSLPFTFSETKATPPTAAQMAGADTNDILAALGFEEAELKAAGAFSAERGKP